MCDHTNEYWQNRIDKLQTELDQLSDLASKNIAEFGMNEAWQLCREQRQQAMELAFKMLTVLLVTEPHCAVDFQKEYNRLVRQAFA